MPRDRTDPGYLTAICRRHGGVLGLCAFVRSNPYTVPEYVPPVLVRLAAHASAPFPVGAAAKACIADFRRTHQDNWDETVAHFDATELSEILEGSLGEMGHYA